MLATPIANKCTLQVPAVPASPSRLRAAPLPPLPPVARRLPMGYRRRGRPNGARRGIDTLLDFIPADPL
jgi:hypothetical protein